MMTALLHGPWTYSRDRGELCHDLVIGQVAQDVQVQPTFREPLGEVAERGDISPREAGHAEQGGIDGQQFCR